MPEFKYNGKTITYHSFNSDVERCIIPLGKPKGRRTALYEFASKFGSPDSSGFRFKVLWMTYEDESDFDKASETLKMMENSSCEKATFVLFDEEGAKMFAEILKLRPECIVKAFADDEEEPVIREALKEAADLPEIEYCYAQDEEDMFFAIRTSLFSKKMDCPFCGKPMQMGYVYANQSIQAYWTMDPDLIGTGNEFDKSGKVLPLRENFRNHDTLSELLTGVSKEDVSKGYLCRSCGKMLIDMSHALIHYRDRTFFKANDLPEDYREIPEDEEDNGIIDTFTVWGESLKGMFGKKKTDPGLPKSTEKVSREERDAERKYGRKDETKKRGLFGPKVE